MSRFLRLRPQLPDFGNYEMEWARDAKPESLELVEERVREATDELERRSTSLDAKTNTLMTSVALVLTALGVLGYDSIPSQVDWRSREGAVYFVSLVLFASTALTLLQAFRIRSFTLAGSLKRLTYYLKVSPDVARWKLLDASIHAALETREVLELKAFWLNQATRLVIISLGWSAILLGVAAWL